MVSVGSCSRLSTPRCTQTWARFLLIDLSALQRLRIARFFALSFL